MNPKETEAPDESGEFVELEAFNAPHHEGDRAALQPIESYEDYDEDEVGGFVGSGPPPKPSRKHRGKGGKRKGSKSSQILQWLRTIPRAKLIFLAALSIGCVLCAVVLVVGFFTRSPALVTDSLILERREIDKSPGDPKNYRLVKLKNHLWALLIQKEGTQTAAASLSVGTGSFGDPKTIPGLAHFLEHMLFMGTKKYPDEASYGNFIMEHGGYFNAYTAGEETNYYLEIDSHYLEEAVDRFSQFFIAPLLKKGSSDREVQAVNAEHQKNIDNDDWKFYQLLKSTTNPAHPYNKFSTGNVTTLQDDPVAQGIDVHQQMLLFFQTNYVSSNMRLVVLGNETLDQLEEIIAKRFVKISNQPFFPDNDRPPLYLPGSLGRQFTVTPVADRNQLVITWPLPSVLEDVLTNPIGGYIGHLLGDEGHGSLLSALKAKNYANGLSAGLYEDYSDFSIMSVIIELTEAGVADHSAVVGLVYDYLALMKVQPLEWVFEEKRHLDQLAWQFPDEKRVASVVSGLSSWLHVTLSPKEILLNPALTRFDSKLVTSLLSKLSPDNSLVFLVTKDITLSNPKYEHYYGTHYEVVPFTSEQLATWSGNSGNPALQLPTVNVLIVSDTSLIPLSTQHPTLPFILTNTSSVLLWYKWDTTFRLPKAALYLHLISTKAYETVENYALSVLFVRSILDSASELLYHAQVAGYTYSLEVTKTGLTLKLFGFSEKLSYLGTYLIGLMVDGAHSPDNFPRIKAELLLALENSFYTDAWQQSMQLENLLLVFDSWSTVEVIEALGSIDFDSMTSFGLCLAKSFTIEASVTGNILPTTAKLNVQSLSSRLQGTVASGCPALSPENQNIKRFYRVADVNVEALTFVYRGEQTNPSDSNSAITSYFQMGKLDTQSHHLTTKACFDYIAYVIREPFFSQLRTVEALGYVVRAVTVATRDVVGLNLQVQSAQNPVFLQERVEAFLTSFADKVVNEAEFPELLKLIVNAKTQRPLSLQEDADRAWKEILMRTYVFNRADLEAAAVSKLTPLLVRHYYGELFAGGLHIHVSGGEPAPIKPLPNVFVSSNVTDFRLLVESY